MSDPISRIDQLAARARQALPPEEASVAPAVLRQIQLAPAPSDSPLWWFALGSVLAAAGVLMVNLPVLHPGTDSTELAMYAGWMML
jgi:hypothetical protein